MSLIVRTGIAGSPTILRRVWLIVLAGWESRIVWRLAGKSLVMKWCRGAVVVLGWWGRSMA